MPKSKESRAEKIRRQLLEQSPYWNQEIPWGESYEEHQRKQNGAPFEVEVQEIEYAPPVEEKDLSPRQRKLRLVSILAAIVVLFLAVIIILPMTNHQLARIMANSESALEEEMVQMQKAVLAEVQCGDTHAYAVNVDDSGLYVCDAAAIREGEMPELILADGTVCQAAAVDLYEKPGLALLWLDAEGELPALKLASRDAYREEKVYLIGDPLGEGWTVCQAVLEGGGSLAGWDGKISYVKGAVSSAHRCCPVYKDDGTLAGIVFAVLTDKEGTAAIIPASWFRECIYAHEHQS